MRVVLMLKMVGMVIGLTGLKGSICQPLYTWSASMSRRALLFETHFA
jgi:hypothetical protein